MCTLASILRLRLQVVLRTTGKSLGLSPEKPLGFSPSGVSHHYFYHPELRGLRILPLQKFEKYLLFYRLREEENVIEIVRIIHGARDIPSLFGQTAAGSGEEQKAT